MVINVTVNIEVKIEDDWIAECWNEAGLTTEKDQMADAVCCAHDTLRDLISHYQHYDPVRCKVVEIIQTDVEGETLKRS